MLFSLKLNMSTTLQYNTVPRFDIDYQPRNMLSSYEYPAEARVDINAYTCNTQQRNQPSSQTLPPMINIAYASIIPAAIPIPAHDQVPHLGGTQQECFADTNINNDPLEQQSQGNQNSLDYNLKEMADFISAMGYSILQPSEIIGPKFERSLCKVLTATRLPKSTLLLSLVYLSQRKKIENCQLYISESNIFKMIVISLVLANKFNDDNTFTNRAWSDATQIPISEITRMESSWLTMIHWSVHLNDADLNLWYQWRDSWENWIRKDYDSPTSSEPITPRFEVVSLPPNINNLVNHYPTPPPEPFNTLSGNPFNVNCKWSEEPQQIQQRPVHLPTMPQLKSQLEQVQQKQQQLMSSPIRPTPVQAPLFPAQPIVLPTLNITGDKFVPCIQQSYSNDLMGKLNQFNYAPIYQLPLPLPLPLQQVPIRLNGHSYSCSCDSCSYDSFIANQVDYTQGQAIGTVY